MSVIILRGYPASGKSTWARKKAQEGGYFIVNRDTIRTQLTGSDNKQALDYQLEKVVTDMAHEQARVALNAGLNVIIDATNLRRKFAVQWANLAHEMGVPYEVLDVDTPAEECVRRNNARANPVSEGVIEQYAQRFPINNWPEITPSERQVFRPYVRDTTKPPAVIFDLDGTLCDMNGRDPYDASTCEDDLPREAVVTALGFIPLHVPILFVSGRSIDYFEETAKWIDKHTGVLVDEGNLLMRAAGDSRKDSIVKDELFEQYIAPYFNILFIYDDRKQVVDMWRAKGLDCFQVAEGDF